MKFTKDQAFQFQKVGIKGWVYLGKDNFPQTGICLVETNKGHETIIKSTKSAWLYFIIKGKGKFVINNKEFPSRKDDLILVSRDTPFYYRGKMKMLLITVPAWEEKYEVTLGRAPS